MNPKKLKKRKEKVKVKERKGFLLRNEKDPILIIRRRQPDQLLKVTEKSTFFLIYYIDWIHPYIQPIDVLSTFFIIISLFVFFVLRNDRWW